MTATIIITNTTLTTPDGVIEACWEDRETGLLSREAGLALMPYINADDRQVTIWERLAAQGASPDGLGPLHTYWVEGEEAFVGKEVVEEADGERPTGRVFVMTLSTLRRTLASAT